MHIHNTNADVYMHKVGVELIHSFNLRIFIAPLQIPNQPLLNKKDLSDSLNTYRLLRGSRTSSMFQPRPSHFLGQTIELDPKPVKVKWFLNTG